MSIVIWETKDVLECPPAPAECAFPTGESVLDYLDFEGGNEQLWLNALFLVSRGFSSSRDVLRKEGGQRAGTGRRNGEILRKPALQRGFNNQLHGEQKRVQMRKHSVGAAWGVHVEQRAP